MANTEILTIEEIEDLAKRLQDFLTRLKPTLALANRNRQILDTIGTLNQLVAESPTPSVAAPAPTARAPVAPKPKRARKAIPAPATAAPKAPRSKPARRVAPAPAAAAPESKPAPKAAPPPATATTDEAVFEFIRRAPTGVTLRQIVDEFGVKADQIHYRLKRLRSGKRVTTSGKQPRMLYRAATEPAAAVAMQPRATKAKKAAPAKRAPKKALPEAAKETKTHAAQPASGALEHAVLDLLRKAGSEGLVGGDIRGALQSTDHQFRTVMARLRGAGQVQMTGGRNQSRYHLAIGGNGAGEAETSG